MNLFSYFRRRSCPRARGDWRRRGRCRPGSTSRASRSSRRATPRTATRDQRGDGAGRSHADPKPREIADAAGRQLQDAPRRSTAADIARARALSTCASSPASGTRAWREILRPANATATRRSGGGERVNVEYVSANPTGPMHVGHGRGAVVGDALAALLEKAGFAVAPRVLHQRRRRPGRRARPLGPPALPRGAGRGRSPRSPRASIPANT